MKAQYIEAPNIEQIKHNASLFLGGGITNCSDWQKEVIAALKDKEMTIVNPRRENFDVTDPSASAAQIDWEYDYLRECNQVMFWFSSETVCPITLFELGATLERWHYEQWLLGQSNDPVPPQTIFIGCHPEYKRILDVTHQARRKGFGVIVGLENLIKAVKEHNE
jgi:hypothetical protein